MSDDCHAETRLQDQFDVALELRGSQNVFNGSCFKKAEEFNSKERDQLEKEESAGSPKKPSQEASESDFAQEDLDKTEKKARDSNGGAPQDEGLDEGMEASSQMDEDIVIIEEEEEISSPASKKARLSTAQPSEKKLGEPFAFGKITGDKFKANISLKKLLKKWDCRGGFVEFRDLDKEQNVKSLIFDDQKARSLFFDNVWLAIAPSGCTEKQGPKKMILLRGESLFTYLRKDRSGSAQRLNCLDNKGQLTISLYTLKNVSLFDHLFEEAQKLNDGFGKGNPRNSKNTELAAFITYILNEYDKSKKAFQLEVREQIRFVGNNMQNWIVDYLKTVKAKNSNKEGLEKVLESTNAIELFVNHITKKVIDVAKIIVCSQLSSVLTRGALESLLKKEIFWPLSYHVPYRLVHLSYRQDSKCRDMVRKAIEAADMQKAWNAVRWDEEIKALQKDMTRDAEGSDSYEDTDDEDRALTVDAIRLRKKRADEKTYLVVKSLSDLPYRKSSRKDFEVILTAKSVVFITADVSAFDDVYFDFLMTETTKAKCYFFVDSSMKANQTNLYSEKWQSIQYIPELRRKRPIVWFQQRTGAGLFKPDKYELVSMEKLMVKLFKERIIDSCYECI